MRWRDRSIVRSPDSSASGAAAAAVECGPQQRFAQCIPRTDGGYWDGTKAIDLRTQHNTCFHAIGAILLWFFALLFVLLAASHTSQESHSATCTLSPTEDAARYPKTQA